MLALIAALYGSLLALNIWLFWIRPARPWTEKFGTVLQIVGLYTLAFGVIAQTKILPAPVIHDLSSPDLLMFLRGNATTWAIVSALLSMALEPEKTSHSAFAILQLFGTLVLGVLGLGVVLFYAFVVAPLSYVAYALVSLPMTAVTTAASNVAVEIDRQATPVKEIITANSVVIKNFLISFTSLAFKMGLDIETAFRTARRRAREGHELQRPGWLMRHPRIANALLLGTQGILGMLLFVLVVGGLIVPALASEEERGPVGEIVGAGIVTALFIWGLVALLLKARRRRKLITAPRPDIESVAAIT